jgi:hypothetical protein
MCKQSCCPGKSREGTGIAAVAALAAGAIVAVKIGPIVARIFHIVIEVLTIVMLTAASALACIVLTFLTVKIVRWQLIRHRAHQAAILRPVPDSARHHIRAGTTASCLACGDTGTVLRAINGGRRHQESPCPVCEPAAKAG